MLQGYVINQCWFSYVFRNCISIVLLLTTTCECWVLSSLDKHCHFIEWTTVLVPSGSLDRDKSPAGSPSGGPSPWKKQANKILSKSRRDVKLFNHQLWSFQPQSLLVLPASASAGPSSLHLRWSFQLPQTAGFPAATQHWIHYEYATNTLRRHYGYTTDTHRIHVGKIEQRTSCLVFGLKWSYLKDILPCLRTEVEHRNTLIAIHASQ